MLTKFLDFDKIYNFCFNEKIVTPKNLPLQAFVIATLENSFGRSTLESIHYNLVRKIKPHIGGQVLHPRSGSRILAQQETIR